MATKKSPASKTATTVTKKASAPAKAAAETVEKLEKVETKTLVEATPAPEAKAEKNSEDFAQKFFPEFAKLNESYEEIAALGQANFGAYVQSAERLTKGFEDLNRHWASYTQAWIEDVVTVSKELASCSSVDEVVEVQNSFSQKTMDGFVAETSRISEMSITVANEAIEPIKSRVDATVETINKSVAA